MHDIEEMCMSIAESTERQVIPLYTPPPIMKTIMNVLGASEVSANLYCNSRTSVLGRLRDWRLLMGRTLQDFQVPACL